MAVKQKAKCAAFWGTIWVEFTWEASWNGHCDSRKAWFYAVRCEKTTKHEFLSDELYHLVLSFHRQASLLGSCADRAVCVRSVTHPVIVFWPKILSLLRNWLYSPTCLAGGGVRGCCLHSFSLNFFLFRRQFINFLLTHGRPGLLLAANLRHLLACRFWMNVRARVCSVQGEVATGQCNPALCASNASSLAVLTCSRCTDSS